MIDASPNLSWVASVHPAARGGVSLGMAVVVDERRLLTAAHVVVREGAPSTGLWVEFPLCEESQPRRAVSAVRVAEAYAAGDEVADVAMIELAEPVPAGVVAAPLRLVKPSAVVEQVWWAFGFPRGRAFGNPAAGSVTGLAGRGWVLVRSTSRPGLAHGFSGTGLWSPQYGAVTGLIGQANDEGDGLAVTLHSVGQLLPAEKIELLTRWTVRSADTVAQMAWSWTLAGDVEADRHWRPRARGVAVSSERGHRFRGRVTALTEIIAWMARDVPDRRVLVVTGSPGVGKSAVLGRIVTSADGQLGADPPDDDSSRAPIGAVGCAVHVKGKTALDVAREIARAASLDLPDRPDDLAPLLRDALAERGRRRFTVVVDALDEATDAGQARQVVATVLLPVAQTCADEGAQIIVGTRRVDSAGDLLAEFGPAATVIDLDADRYFARADLAAYAQATLQLRGAERPDNPYQDDAVAGPVAARIAALAEPNFLVAGLVARSHGLYDRTAAEPGTITFTADVRSALAGYVALLPAVGAVSARDALMALAFAETPGLTARLWSVAIAALTGETVTSAQVTRFARGSAANFLVESADDTDADDRRSSFRLFHQALGDVLRAERATLARNVDDQAALTTALLAHGRAAGWERAEPYLLRSLPSHAHEAGQVDALLADVGYLLRADLRRLLMALADVYTPSGSDRARILRLTPRAVDVAPELRLGLLGVTESMESTATTFRNHPGPVPFRALWARTTPRVERSVFDGHTGAVATVCPILIQGRGLLASAGDDGTVRIWDPITGQTIHILTGHTDWVTAVCPIHIQGRDLLATTSYDRTVRIWDLTTSWTTETLVGHTGPVAAICPVHIDGHVLLASAGDDGTVRIWDPTTGQTTHTLTGHTSGISAISPIRVHGRDLLATASHDGTVRIWDPTTGRTTHTLTGHTDWVTTVCPIRVQDRDLLATASHDATVRIWDPTTGQTTHTLTGHTNGISAVSPIRVQGRDLLASASEDTTARIWDPTTGQTTHTLTGHTSPVTALCPIRTQGQDLLATASEDATVRIWDPTTSRTTSASRTTATRTGHTGPVTAVCPIQIQGREMLASAGEDATARIWDPTTGQITHTLTGHTSPATALCPIQIQGREMLASAGEDATARIWDPTTSQIAHTLTSHTDWVTAVCPIHLDGRDLLASASADRTVRIWDPTTGQTTHTLTGHADWVTAVCPIRIDGRDLLATASHDATVRIWDPTTSQTTHTLTSHTDYVTAVCPIHLDGRDLLASASADRTVRIWDLTTGQTTHTLTGHTDWVSAVCPIHIQGRDLLATVSHDRTVCIWDPTQVSPVIVVPVHHPGRAISSWARGNLFVGLDAGVLALKISEIGDVHGQGDPRRKVARSPR